MCCLAYPRTNSSSRTQKEVPIPDWELGQRDPCPRPGTQPGNNGLQGARVLPVLCLPLVLGGRWGDNGGEPALPSLPEELSFRLT